MTFGARGKGEGLDFASDIEPGGQADGEMEGEVDIVPDKVGDEGEVHTSVVSRSNTLREFRTLFLIPILADAVLTGRSEKR